jgi:hypothetical protein
MNRRDLRRCSICETADHEPVLHPEATEKDDGCPYVKKSARSGIVEVRRVYGRFGYYVFDGGDGNSWSVAREAKLLEHFDYWSNAMRFAKRFAKALKKGSVRYVRETL